jgi:outer membrane receptor protein involved in Fe transport
MLHVPLILALSTPVRAEEEVRDEVIVEASRVDVRTAWDSAASVTVFSVDERTPAGASIGSIVSQAPGVHLQQFGTADSFSGVSIRGSTLRQVAMYLDGIPLNPDGGQVVNLSEWPLRSLQRIEVYRGNAPASLGGAAMGGAIDLISADTEVALTGGMSAETTQRFTLDGYSQHTINLLGQPQTLTLFSEAVVSQGRYRYFSDNGTPFNRTDDRRLIREHNATGSTAGLFRWSTKLGAFDVNILDTWIRRGQELPGHINNPSQHARIDLWRNLLGWNAKTRSRAHRFEATGWFSHRSERYDDRMDELGLDAQWTEQNSQNLGLRIHDAFAVHPWLAIGLTATTQTDQPHELNLITDTESEQPSRWMTSATVDAPMNWGSFAATPVGHSTWVFSPTEDQPPLVSVDPRLGLRYSVDENLNFRANGGRYLRAPDTTELYGDRGTMIGNPELRPERGWQWDIGGRHKWSRGRRIGIESDIGHFWNASQDRITWVQNGQKTLRPMNFGRTWVQGMEAALEVAFDAQLRVRPSVTWTRSVNLSTAPAVANNQLPGVPTWSSSTTSTWTQAGGRIHLGHVHRFTDGNFWDATNWYKAAPRQFHDLFVQLRAPTKGLQAEFGVQNLTDTFVDVMPQNPLQPDNGPKAVQALTDFSGHPLPGRTWTLGLRWVGVQP